MKKYQKIVDKAISLLEQWQEYENEMRNYEHQNWHCVNVKRYDDHLSDDELISLAKKVTKNPLYQSKLVDMYKKDAENYEYNIYYSWLNFQWDMLNEDINYCDELKGGLNYLSSDNWCKKPILSLGRSGGWACFQMTEEIDEQKEKEKIGKDYIEKLTKSKNDKVSRLAKGLLKIL